MTILNQCFRCAYPISFGEPAELSPDRGYFGFGPRAVCYGRTSKGYRSNNPGGPLYDAASDVSLQDGATQLPFDPDEVFTSLTQEQYLGNAPATSFAQRLYYSIRPLLPVAIRSELQHLYYRKRDSLHFPSWPIDTTVETLARRLLLLWLKSKQLDSVPFIWFWPDGARACSIMTHDVETEQGRRFCSTLMDLDEDAGIVASFQVVPEQRYQVTPEYLQSIKERGFEVNVQDLNHDGRLFWSLEEFERRAALINRYGREFGAIGFRSAVLYRRQEWFDRLDFDYDMSVPNVGYLDPQPGGCCTVKPYFVGRILELPATTSQDHVVFNLLSDFSLDLWRRQIERIMAENGLISFIVHPDYVTRPRPLAAYQKLLAELCRLRSDEGVWIASPGEVNHWWRQRAQMTLVERQGEWVVEGPGQERARVAYATIQDNELVYCLPQRSPAGCS